MTEEQRGLVTFASIRLRGPGFKPRPGQKFETRFLLHSHPSGGERVSPAQGEALKRRYIKPEYRSYPTYRCSPKQEVRDEVEDARHSNI